MLTHFKTCFFQDVDDVVVHYPGMFEVMTDLQGKLHSCSVVCRCPVDRLHHVFPYFFQEWQKVTVCGTGGHCCTETPCQQPLQFIRVSDVAELMNKLTGTAVEPCHKPLSKQIVVSENLLNFWKCCYQSFLII